MDKILIRGLHARGILGVYEEERQQKRDILVWATLFTDTRRAAKSDSVEDSVDYAAVSEALCAAIEGSAFATVEALAEHLATVCLRFSGVEKALLRVEKPGAVAFVDSVGVEIERP